MELRWSSKELSISEDLIVLLEDDVFIEEFREEFIDETRISSPF